MPNFSTLISENSCEGLHIITDQDLIGFKSGPERKTGTDKPSSMTAVGGSVLSPDVASVAACAGSAAVGPMTVAMPSRAAERRIIGGSAT